MKSIKTICLLLISISLSVAQSESEADDFSYALKLYNQEFYDLAAQQFIKYYNEYPKSEKNDEAKFYAGMSLYMLKEFDQARIEFQSMALEYPKSIRAGESWYKTGECYLHLKNPAEAAKAFETVKILYPDHTFASKGLYQAGLLNMDLGDYERSALNFNTILDRYPGSAEYYPAMMKSAYTLYLRGNIEQARNFLTKLSSAEIDPDIRSETLLISARIYADLGNIEKAQADLTRIVQNYAKTGSYFASLIELGNLFVRTGNYRDAQNYLNKGLSEKLDADPLNQLRFLLADVYYLNGNHALADQTYQQIKMKPCDSLYISVRLKQGLAKHRQKLQSQAIAMLEQTLEECPNTSSTLNKRLFHTYIQWLDEAGLYDKAASAINAMLYLTPDPADKIKLASRLVLFYSNLNRWRDIIREGQSLVRFQDKFPEKDDLVFYLGLSYENIQDYQNASYYYQQLVNEYASSPFYFQATNRLEHLNDYMIIDNRETLSRITGLLGHSFQDSEKGHLQFELGKIYFEQLKDYSNAETVFLATMPVSEPFKGDLHLFLGKTYQKLAYQNPDMNSGSHQYLEKAREQFAKAVENISTCETPDEAAWLLVQSSVVSDTIPLVKEKTYIEKLIQTYPGSEYLEAWYADLAFSLAYDLNFGAESQTYFRYLIDHYKSSSSYTTYLYGYGKFIRETAPEKAMEYFKLIASEYPFSHEAADALYEVAQYYEEIGMYQEANVLYEKLINFYYYSELAQKAETQYGRVKLKAGRYEDAISLFNRSLEATFIKDPVFGQEFLTADQYIDIYYLAEAYKKSGKPEEANKYFRLYLENRTDGIFSNQARLALGAYYFENNQLNVALEHLLLVTDADISLFREARNYIASIYFTNEQYAEAAGHYKTLTDLSRGTQQEDDAFANLIICRIREGNLTEGERLIKQYKDQFKNADNALAQFTIELGEYFRLNKNFSKALNYFSTVQKKYSKSEYADDAEYMIALTNITLNKNEEALKMLSNFPSAFPKSDRLPAVYNTLGTIYFRSEKYDASISTFKKALELTNNVNLEKQIMSNLIKAYTMTGFWDAAQALSRQYVEKYPFSEDIIDKKIIIAQAFINLNQFQNGVDYLKKIKIEADSEREPEIQFYIGEALLKAGQYESAIAEFVKIPLLSKKTKLQWEASALYYAGQAYEKLGRISDAIRMYKEIVTRPGIDLILKKDAAKRIQQIEG